MIDLDKPLENKEVEEYITRCVANLVHCAGMTDDINIFKAAQHHMRQSMRSLYLKTK